MFQAPGKCDTTILSPFTFVLFSSVPLHKYNSNTFYSEAAFKTSKATGDTVYLDLMPLNAKC